MKTVAIVSGGLDSVTLAHLLHSLGSEVFVLSFDYGQKHSKELTFARRCAEDLKAEHMVIDLRALLPVFNGSALTSDYIQVPDGHYAAENMRITIVPNRNAIMLSVAYALAVSVKANAVALGVHSGDHAIYPDCRPEFVSAFEHMEQHATSQSIELLAPFVNMSKSSIVRLGASLEVDYSKTWSCYKGGDVHCGTCGTCVERKEAFKLAQVLDPTTYVVW